MRESSSWHGINRGKGAHIEEQRRFSELQRETTKHPATITEDLRRFEIALLAKAFRGELY